MVPAKTCRWRKAVTNAAEFWGTRVVLVSHAVLRRRSLNANDERNTYPSFAPDGAQIRQLLPHVNITYVRIM